MEKDFVSVTKEFRRMCSTFYHHFEDCKKCPYYWKNVDCSIWDCNTNFSSKDYEKWMEVLESWVNENPPAHYPTYREMIENFFGTEAIRNMDSEIPEELAREYNIAAIPTSRCLDETMVNGEYYSEWR